MEALLGGKTLQAYHEAFAASEARKNPSCGLAAAELDSLMDPGCKEAALSAFVAEDTPLGMPSPLHSSLSHKGAGFGQDMGLLTRSIARNQSWCDFLYLQENKCWQLLVWNCFCRAHDLFQGVTGVRPGKGSKYCRPFLQDRCCYSREKQIADNWKNNSSLNPSTQAYILGPKPKSTQMKRTYPPPTSS